MKQIFLLIACLLYGGLVMGQATYSSSPALNTYGSCPSTNYTTTSCGFAYYGNSVQRGKLTSISGSTATFTGSKCAGGTYSTGSIAYLKESTSSSVSSLICATVVSQVNIDGLSSFNLTHNLGTTSGTKYYVIVVLSGSDNTRYYSNTISVTTTVTAPPATPTGLSANATGSNTINLSWNSVSGAATYHLYRATSCSGSYSQIYWAGTNGYTDSGSQLSPNTTYCYKVSSNATTSSTGTQSALSSCVCSTTLPAVPATPTGLTATATSGSSINLTWNAVSGATSYSVYTCTGTFVGTATSNSYTATGLTANTTYSYKILANNAGGSSSFTSCASATPTYPPFAAPTLVSPANTATLSTAPISFDWNDVSGATSYRIQVATSPTGWDNVNGFSPASVVYETTSTTSAITWSNPVSGTTYYWSIRAGNSSTGQGGYYASTRSFTYSTSTSDGNDLPSQAVNITLNSNASSIIADQNDNDWYKFIIPANGTGRVSIGINVGTADMQARVFDSNILTAANPNSITTYSIVATYDADGNPMNNNGAGINEFYDNIDVVGGQTYYIKVALQNTPATNQTVIVHIDYLKNPNLTTPANSATSVSTTPTLTWENIGATQYRDQIQLNASAWGNDPWTGLPLNQGAITTNTYTLTAAQALLANTPYKWRVRGFKPCQLDPTNHSVTTKWSNEGGTDWTFTTSNTCPNTCTTFTNYTDYCAEAYRSACYLQQQGVLDAGQNYTTNNTTPVNRAELAKMLSIALHGTSYTSPAAVFPNPFNDLQDPTAWYHRYAIDLSYLEYGDGIAPFRRDRFNFYPANNIERRHVLKALLETFNIAPDWNGYNPASNAASTIYTDVKVNDDAYGYINKAKQLGIISSSNTTFSPYTYATREEVILMIYRVLTANPALTPVANANSSTSYFTPGNYTPANLSAGVGIERGTAEYPEETALSLNGLVSMVLNFGYSSQLSELPDDLAARKDSYGNLLYDFMPLGRDWWHNFNSFIINIDEASNTTDDNRLLIQLPTSHVVYNTVTNTFVTQGTFFTLTQVGSTVIEIRTKGYVTYRFEQLAGAYNKLYFLTAIRDRNNNTLTFTYENGYNTAYAGPATIYTVKRLKEVTDPYARKITFTYFANSNRIQTASETGLNRSVSFTYSNLPTSNTAPRLPLLATYTNAKGGVTSYAYETNANTRDLLRQVTEPNGNPTVMTYGNNRKLASRTKGTLTTNINFTTAYTSGNAATSSTLTQNGKTTTFAHNNNGLPSSITPPGASSTTIGYGTGALAMLPTNITNNTAGLIQNNTYDANGNLTQQTIVGGTFSITKSFQYNGFNDPTSYTNPLGYVTTMGYNTTGNLTSITAPNGAVSTITPNANGSIAAETAPNPGGGATAISATYTYGSYGLVSSVSQSGIAGSTTLGYDAAGRNTTVTDNLGRTSTYTYDNNDNQTAHQAPAPLNYLTSMAYDANDNLTGITNAKGFTTTFSRNTATDLLQSVSFEGSTHSYTYNTDGTPASHTKPSGQTLNLTYNNDYTIANNGYATYGYDSRKNVTAITKDSKTIALAYDALNRPTSTTYDGKTVGYAYNNNSQNTSISYPGSLTITYTYNNIGQCTEMRNQNNAVLYTATYRPDGLISQENYGNGTRVEYGYDAAGRLISKQHKRSNGTVICGYTHTFDAVDNITQATNTEPYAMPLPTGSTENGTYGNNNRLNTYGGDTFAHNADGNTTSISGGTYNATLTYDTKDNLTASSGTLNEVYEYDGTEGRRRKGNTRYVLDVLHNNNVLAETDLSGNVLYYYLHTPDGRLIARHNVSTNTTQYYHADYRGSIIALTNAAQTITHQYQYDAWGKVLQSQEPANDANAYRYVGQYGVQYDSPRQTYMRQRYYDPNTGRFRSEDPVWSTNLFPYADNNPVTRIDKMGTFSTPVHNAIIDLAFEKNDASQIFKDASANIDGVFNGGQSVKNSYMHAMRSKNQTIEEAKQLYEIFLDAQIREYAKTGDYNYVGYGMHAIMDSYSPEHDNFPVWEGLCGPIVFVKAALHGLSEESFFVRFAEEKAQAAQAIRDYWDKAYFARLDWLQYRYYQKTIAQAIGGLY